MRKNNFALRLQPSIMERLRQVAEEEQTTLNQYINVAVAEKLASHRTAAEFFADRASRANVKKALRILDKLGSEEPQPGDLIKDRGKRVKGIQRTTPRSRRG